MIKPSIAELLEHVDSRYTLTIAVAKRARQLNEGALSLTDFESTKNVSVAINEINEGKVTYYRNKSEHNNENIIF